MDHQGIQISQCGKTFTGSIQMKWTGSQLRLLALRLHRTEQGVEFVNQNLLGNHTHNLIDNPTLFEKQQVGTA